MLSAKELLAQSPVKIDKWIDMGSKEFQDNDPYPMITKHVLEEISENTGTFVTDELGRIWGNNGSYFYPLHDEQGGVTIGYRLVRKAGN